MHCDVTDRLQYPRRKRFFGRDPPSVGLKSKVKGVRIDKGRARMYQFDAVTQELIAQNVDFVTHTGSTLSSRSRIVIFSLTR